MQADVLSASARPWKERLDAVLDLMREMSRQTDPQEMVQAYIARVSKLIPVDRRISLSRRDLRFPEFRVTRYSEWTENINPWKDVSRLPVHRGGLFAELLYSDSARVIPDLAEFPLAPDDPAAEYVAGQRTLMAIPMLERGVSINMSIATRSEPHAVDFEKFPEHVWMANLFGRATHNLVLADQVKSAFEEVDRELKAVAGIQRSLLPSRLPEISTLKLAAHYQTARRAGGDYYDFFPLPDGNWGILVADVSGHGTPAAVMMAVTHSIAHNYPGPPDSPGQLLRYLNKKLCDHYVGDNGTFVTAFYAIYEPKRRKLTYSSAGHNPPRVRGCGRDFVFQLDHARHLPLGVSPDVEYGDASHYLQTGDQLILYTDGIVEAMNPQGDLLGTDRLDHILGRCATEPTEILKAVLQAVETHTQGAPPSDDRTLVVGRVT